MANFLVAGFRWLKGVGSLSRKNPWTGAPESRGFRTGWMSDTAAPKVESRFKFRPQHIAMPSTGIGMGRIGVGEAIGTRKVHELGSLLGAREAAGAGAAIGLSRIGGREEKGAGITARGAKGRFIVGGGGG